MFVWPKWKIYTRVEELFIYFQIHWTEMEMSNYDFNFRLHLIIMKKLMVAISMSKEYIYSDDWGVEVH